MGRRPQGGGLDHRFDSRYLFFRAGLQIRLFSPGPSDMNAEHNISRNDADNLNGGMQRAEQITADDLRQPAGIIGVSSASD
jgi:hypothetical protein